MKAFQRIEAQMQVTLMGRVERAAKKTDPVMPADMSAPFADPARAAGSTLSRTAGAGAERCEADEGQGRT
jgi:hypothetical protein